MIVIAIIALFLSTGKSPADGPPWKPDYSSPERTVLTYCLARCLPEGGREIMERAFHDRAEVTGHLFWQACSMCRVSEVGPVYEWPEHKKAIPGQVQVVLEAWDPKADEAERFTSRTWFKLVQAGEEWKIVDWATMSESEYPPDDVYVCQDRPWLGRPVLSGPDVVVCAYALEQSHGNAARASMLMAPGAAAPDDGLSGLYSADIAAVRPESLAVNGASVGVMPEDAEVDLDVGVLDTSQGQDAFRYRFLLRRTGDEWKIARIEYLGPRPDGEDPAGEGK
ncbi:MAG: hypothetical protein AB1916_13220 [Thermodesulfobacteriota bacterium]